jgi:branched-chain amino acid aminotransferase
VTDPGHLDPPLVPADDRGFLLGDALFETVRLYGGRPFLLSRHLERLREGARVVGIPVPEAELESRLGRALEGWSGRDGALRITLSRGPGWGLHPPRRTEPRLVLALRPWDPDPRWYADGLRAAVAGQVAEGALSVRVKGSGYLERILALREASRRGAGEALLRNGRGELVEGSASNLLALVEGRIVAPGPKEGALPGITREVVLALLREAGREVEERGLRPEELPSAEELLLTSSLREIVPVVEVDGARVGHGRPGPLTKRLLRAYREAAD